MKKLLLLISITLYLSSCDKPEYCIVCIETSDDPSGIVNSGTTYEWCEKTCDEARHIKDLFNEGKIYPDDNWECTITNEEGLILEK